MGVRKVNPLTESGMLAAISVIMALIGVYVPLVGPVIFFIWPLSIIILVVRHGLRWGTMVLVASGLLIFILVPLQQAIVLIIPLGVPGLVMGYMYLKGCSALRLLLMTSVASFLSAIASLMLLMALLQINQFESYLNLMSNGFKATAEIWRNMGWGESEIASQETIFRTNLEMISQLFPIILIITSVFQTCINIIIAGKILKRLGNTGIARFKPFVEWRMPLWAAYLYAFALIGVYWGPQLESTLLFQVSINGYVFASMLGFVQGMTLLVKMAEERKLSGFIKSVFLILILINAFFYQVVTLIGMVDIIFDLRQRMAAWRR